MPLLPQTNISIDNEVSCTSVTVIHIIEDKLINILTRHVSRLKRPRDIAGAFALTLSLLIVLLTATFKKTGALTPDMWSGIFGTLFVVSVIYTIYTIYNYFKDRSSVEDIIRDIKNNERHD